MDVSRQQIEIHIGKLTVEAPNRIDSGEFSNALERELTRLQGGDPWQQPEAADGSNRKVVNSIEVESRSSSAALGSEVARTVHDELQR